MEITNRSDRTLMPKIVFLKDVMQGIMINGISGQQIGKIIPGNTKSIPLTLFPTQPGVQKISGIQIIDESTQKKFDFQDVLHVFVDT